MSVISQLKVQGNKYSYTTCSGIISDKTSNTNNGRILYSVLNTGDSCICLFKQQLKRWQYCELVEVLTKQEIMALLPYAEEVQENFGQLQNKKLMETKVTHILAHTSAKAAFIIILTLFLLLNSTSKDIKFNSDHCALVHQVSSLCQWEKLPSLNGLSVAKRSSQRQTINSSSQFYFSLKIISLRKQIIHKLRNSWREKGQK